MCGCGHGYGIRIRKIESVHVAIRNASAHKTHVKFLGVTIMNGGWPLVSRGRALKSFRMLLDRRRRLVNDLCTIQPLSILCVLCLFFHNL